MLLECREKRHARTDERLVGEGTERVGRIV